MLQYLNGLNPRLPQGRKIVRLPKLQIHQILPPSHYQNLTAPERKAVEVLMNTPPEKLKDLSAPELLFFKSLHPRSPSKIGFNLLKSIKDAGASIKATTSKAAANFTPAAIKSFAKDMTKGGITGTFKRIAAAPLRAAFIGVVELNGLGLAKKLAAGWAKDPAKVTKFWEGAGGDINLLKRAINNGAKTTLSGTASLGFVLATAIATATPLIISAMALIKQLVPSAAPTAAEQAQLDQASAAFKADNGIETVTNPDGTTTNVVKTPFYKNPMVIIPVAGAVLVGGYFVFKKKSK